MRIETVLSGFALLLAVVAAAACGAEAEPEGAGDTSPPPDTAAATSLEITIWPQGEGQGDELAYTLTCDPPGGDHPDPTRACAALAELGAEAFAPVPADVLCTQIYGGPMQARVRGTIGGEPVDARLAYNDGCQIARWDAVTAVVPLRESA